MLQDDVLMLCQHGEKELENFLEFLNSYHLTIKFTANYSPDISVKISNNQLFIDLCIRLKTRNNIYMLTHVCYSNESTSYS